VNVDDQYYGGAHRGITVTVYPGNPIKRAEREALTNIELDGLGPPHRKAMYEILSDIDFPGRPRIGDWVDLIKNWDFASG